MTVTDNDSLEDFESKTVTVVHPTIYLSIDAPDEAEMLGDYDIYLNISMGDSWPGGEVLITLERRPMNMIGELNDYGFWTFYIFNNESGSWIREHTYYEFSSESVLVNIEPNETIRCRLTGYHQWPWIEPWDFQKISDIIKSFGLDLLWPPDGNIISELAQTVAEILTTQEKITYIYTATCQDTHNTDTTIVRVPSYKYQHLAGSVLTSILGWVATEIGTTGDWRWQALEIAFVIESEISFTFSIPDQDPSNMIQNSVPSDRFNSILP